MPYETAKDVLEHARDYHRILSDFYNKLGAKAQKQRAKMLLDYLSRHEKHLEDSLAEYEKEVSQKIQNTWFQYSPPKHVLATCEELSLDGKENLNLDDVVEMALRFDECLVQLYQEMVKNAETDEVREAFQNLLEMEKKEELKLVKDAFQLKEM